jgi:hypothetical protein
LLSAAILLVLLGCSGRTLLDRSGGSDDEEIDDLGGGGGGGGRSRGSLRSGAKQSSRAAVRGSNAAFAGVLVFYLVGMACLGLFGDPFTHVSFGYHQPWGGRCERSEGTTACRREQADASWRLCNETFQEFPIASVDYRERTVGWYGICGRTRAENSASLHGAVIVSLLGLLWYATTLVFCEVKKKTATTKKVV